MTFNYVKGWIDEGPNFSAIQGRAFPSIVKNTSSDLIYDLKVTVYESSSGNWKKKLVELNTSNVYASSGCARRTDVIKKIFVQDLLLSETICYEKI